MDNTRNFEIDWPPELRAAKRRILVDLERLAMIHSLLAGVLQGGELRKEFIGTYRGHAFRFIEISLFRDAVSTLDRLFSAPGGSGASANLSFLYVLDLLLNDPKASRSFRRSSRRFGASGHFSISDANGTRSLTFSETLRSRIQSAKKKRIETRFEIAKPRFLHSPNPNYLAVFGCIGRNGFRIP